MIPAKILQQIEAAVDKEKTVIYRSAYRMGAQFGFQLAQEIYAPVVEALIKVLESQVVKEAPYIAYSEARTNAVEALTHLREKLGEKP